MRTLAKTGICFVKIIWKFIKSGRFSQLDLFYNRWNVLYYVLLMSCLCVMMTAGHADARQFVRMERPQLGLELKYEFEKEERTGFISDENSDVTYSERLDIKTRGWIYHPALAVYHLVFSPEWEQARANSGGDTVKSDSFLNGFSADMTIFQYKPYSLNIFLRGTVAFA